MHARKASDLIDIKVLPRPWSTDTCGCGGGFEGSTAKHECAREKLTKHLAKARHLITKDLNLFFEVGVTERCIAAPYPSLQPDLLNSRGWR